MKGMLIKLTAITNKLDKEKAHEVPEDLWINPRYLRRTFTDIGGHFVDCGTSGGHYVQESPDEIAETINAS